MDQKLQRMKLMLVVLRFHKLACYISGLLVLVLCVRGIIRHHGPIFENIAFGVMGVGVCTYSMLYGVKQKALLDRQMELIQSGATDAPLPDVPVESAPTTNSPAKKRKR